MQICQIMYATWRVFLRTLSDLRGVGFDKPLTDWKSLTLAIALSIISLSSNAKDQIRSTTRDWVKALEKSSPEFKADRDFVGCLDGTIHDSYCDEYVRDQINMYLDRRSTNERELWLQEKNRLLEERDRELDVHMRQVDEEKRQVNMAREAVENIHIARALLQTVLYREFGQAPSADDDYRTKTQGYTTMRPEIRALIQRHLLEPAPKNQAAWKNDLSQAMTLAKECTDAAIGIQKKLTDTTLSKNIGAMNASFVDYYQVVKRKVSYTK